MPYEHKRTVIQMAPRDMLPGIRLHQARIARGMGQTVYQGPCQDPTQTMDPVTGVCGNALQVAIENLPSTIIPAISIPNQAPIAPTLSDWASQNSGTILIVGGVLFGIAVLGAMRR